MTLQSTDELSAAAWLYFASDVDPHWAGIGADLGVVDRLVADGRIDVVHADPEERQPTYY